MKIKTALCCLIVAAVSVSPALAATKKKTMKRAPQTTSTPAGVVGGAARTAGAVATGAVATAGAIATAPFTAVSTLNGPSCKPGTTVTVNGQKMRCQ
jgi:hypothetical protein